MNEHFFIYNGCFFHSEDELISPMQRAGQFGKGLFETMRLYQGKIINEDFHFERLLGGIGELGFKHSFSSSFFWKEINNLLKKNNHQHHARIRLMVTQSQTNKEINYLIESWPLPSYFDFLENGLSLDFFPDAKKKWSIDAHLKKNDCSVTALARKYADTYHLDDVIILNENERISESSIANVFLIKNNTIYTPPLSEGCVAGTMRRFLIKEFLPKHHQIIEKEISVQELLNADEIFLSNAIRPMRWVKHLRQHTYSNPISLSIWKDLVAYFTMYDR